MIKKTWKFLKRIVLGRDLVVYRLRKYLRKLYEGYPTHYFYGYEIVQGIEEGIENLIEDGIIKGQEFQDGHKQGKTPKYGLLMFIPIMKRKYRLTAEGLKLVDNWNIERLTYWIIGLSIIIMGLGLAQLFFELPILDIISLFTKTP